jgi:hypothetical protein
MSEKDRWKRAKKVLQDEILTHIAEGMPGFAVFKNRMPT